MGGEDFITTNFVATIPERAPLGYEECFNIVILDDFIFEPDQFFLVTVVIDGGPAVVSVPSQTITIRDDDS